jgi:hypothetical protein
VVPSSAIQEAGAAKDYPAGRGARPQDAVDQVEPATEGGPRKGKAPPPLDVAVATSAKAAEDLGPSKPPRDPEKKKRRSRRLRDEFEDDEPKEDRASVLQASIEQSIALVLLFLLALATLFSWLLVEGEWNRYETILGGRVESVYVAKTKRLPPITGLASWQGKVVLAFSTLVALFAAAALIVRCNFDTRGADRLLTLSRCVTGAWGMFVLVCLLGIVFKAMAVSGAVKTTSPPGDKMLRVVPHIGLWADVVVSVAIVAFSFGFSRHRGRGWWLMAQGAALLIGLLIVLAVIQPWNRSSVWGLPLGSEDIHELQIYGK